MKGYIVYDIISWIFNIMLDIFFREIRPRGAHRIPQEGPVIFVAAPHANQVRVHLSICMYVTVVNGLIIV
jgi:hypothetical protein